MTKFVRACLSGGAVVAATGPPSARRSVLACHVRRRAKNPPEKPAARNAALELFRASTQKGRYAFTYVDSIGVIEPHRFVEVSQEAARWAHLMRREGLEHGARVIVLTDRDRHWRSALLGVVEAGGVALPCPASTPLAEIRSLASKSHAAGAVSAVARPDLLAAGVPVLCADDLEARQTPHAHADVAYPTDPHDFAVILNGHNGSFRGAAYTHDALLAQASSSGGRLGVGERERVWCTVPEGSAASLRLVLAAWQLGVELVVVEEEIAAQTRLELLDKLKPAAVWFSDEEYAALAAADAPRWVDLSSIRQAMTSGPPAEGAIAFQNAFGVTAAPAPVPMDAVVAAAVPEPAERPAPSVVHPTPGSSGAPRFARRGLDRRGREQEIIRRRAAAEAERRAEQAAARAGARRRTAEARRREEEHLRQEKEARRREEQEVKERRKEEKRRREEEAKQRRLAERAARDAAEAEARRRAEEAEARERAERASAEEGRRALKAAREAALAEERRRTEEAKRHEEERVRQQEDARRREEQQAKERQKEDERRRTEEDKQRKVAEQAARAEQLRRAQEAKNRELAERAAAEERRRAEAAAYGEERRRAQEVKKRERAERVAADERERAEKAVRQAELARERRAEEERRREERRLREEHEARRREEQEAGKRQKEAERRRREDAKNLQRAARAAGDEQERPATAEHVRRTAALALQRRAEAERRRLAAERAEGDALAPEVISRVSQYRLTTTVPDRHVPEADAAAEPERVPGPDEASPRGSSA